MTYNGVRSSGSRLLNRGSEKLIVTMTPVGARCNMACSYCYHEPLQRIGESVTVMPEHVLEVLISKTINMGDVVQYTWHGGEPLLAGRRFYENAIKLQEKYRSADMEVENHIQSNATLLDEEWIQWLKAHKFNFSTSVDGDRVHHDRHRTYRDGKRTYDDIIHKLGLCEQQGLPYGIVAVINSDNVGDPVGVYEGLKKIAKWGCDLHVCTQRIGSINLVPSVPDATAFYKEVFDLWYSEGDSFFPIRTFVGIMQRLCGGHPTDCTFATHGCKVVLAADMNGDIYPCGRFLRNPEFKCGNIVDEAIESVEWEQVHLVNRNKLSDPPRNCYSCRWWNICGGGCRFERWVSGGNVGAPLPWCSLRKELFKHIADTMAKTIQETLHEKNMRTRQSDVAGSRAALS